MDQCTILHWLITLRRLSLQLVLQGHGLRFLGYPGSNSLRCTAATCLLGKLLLSIIF
jgi:hypothetical protein